jgi:chromosome segregation ATPase
VSSSFDDYTYRLPPAAASELHYGPAVCPEQVERIREDLSRCFDKAARAEERAELAHATALASGAESCPDLIAHLLDLGKKIARNEQCLGIGAEDIGQVGARTQKLERKLGEIDAAYFSQAQRIANLRSNLTEEQAATSRLYAGAFKEIQQLKVAISEVADDYASLRLAARQAASNQDKIAELQSELALVSEFLDMNKVESTPKRPRVFTVWDHVMPALFANGHLVVPAVAGIGFALYLLSMVVK